MSDTPMNNLREPVKQRSSAYVTSANGESKNAKYGPKSWYEEPIEKMKAWADMFGKWS